MTSWEAKPKADDTAVVIVSEKWPQPVAVVHSYASPEIGPTRHERDRHALLLAAAPDLLEQVRNLRQHVMDVFNAEPLDEDTKSIIADADAVLAKAGAA